MTLVQASNGRAFGINIIQHNVIALMLAKCIPVENLY